MPESLFSKVTGLQPATIYFLNFMKFTSNFRSGPLQMFFKIGDLKNFAKGKTSVLESVFSKVTGL